MPVIRTMYDLGPGGISTPDYDAQLALQRQIAGQNAQAQAFNQAMAMHQGSFSQRQEMAKMAMQRELYEAAQAADKERLAYDRGEAEKRAQYQQGTEQYRRDTLEQSRLDRIAREGAVKAKAAADQAAAQKEQESWPVVTPDLAKEFPNYQVGQKVPMAELIKAQAYLQKKGEAQGLAKQEEFQRNQEWGPSADEAFDYVDTRIKAREPLTGTEASKFDKQLPIWIESQAPYQKEAAAFLKRRFKNKFDMLPTPREEVTGFQPGTFFDQLAGGWNPLWLGEDLPDVPLFDEDTVEHYSEQTKLLNSHITEALNRLRAERERMAPKGPGPWR